MPPNGPEKAVDGRKRPTGIWLAPRGGTALSVDLRGACIWISLNPPASMADVEYIQSLARQFGYSIRLVSKIAATFIELDLHY
jgi:hypothetical protein